MKSNKTILFLILLMTSFFLKAQKNEYVIIKGTVFDKENNKVLKGANIKIKNSTWGDQTEGDGNFEIMAPKVKHLTLEISHINYKSLRKELDLEFDTIQLNFFLSPEIYTIPDISVYAKLKPDTVFGTYQFSVVDFDFYEDKYILLTLERKTNEMMLRFVDGTQKVLSKIDIPQEGGIPKELYRDFMGYINLICEKAIYRIKIKNEIISIVELPFEDYNALVKPVIDTVNKKLIFSNYNKDFPLFKYFFYQQKDSSIQSFHTVENKDLMEAYRFEYYALKPKEKLLARELAEEYHIDKHKAAAYLTGFTKSMFYTPLYAPLYVIHDTIAVFDHYQNLLFHFGKDGRKLDSMKINYHHPKNWKEWKNKMLKDDVEEQVYALYQKDGHGYLKRINSRNGKEEGSYKLIHHSADKIKINEGWVYYVYRPFESNQEKYLYKEKLILKQ